MLESLLLADLDALAADVHDAARDADGDCEVIYISKLRWLHPSCPSFINLATFSVVRKSTHTSGMACGSQYSRVLHLILA